MLTTLLLMYLSGFVATFGFILFIDRNSAGSPMPLDLHLWNSSLWPFHLLSLLAMLLDAEDI